MIPRLARLPGPPIVCVDGGARGARRHRLLKHFPDMRLIGFEPDARECEALNRDARDGFRVIPVALARGSGVRTLHVTRNPACSSMLPPNMNLLGGLLELGPGFETATTVDVDTASLDTLLPSHDVGYVDFLKLDTQGTELEILEGSEHYLRTSILAVQVEVEFAEMYVGQPLFSDVDRFLRDLGFCLFDLTRYRVRRARFPRASATRGQLLWGQAFYLKNADLLSETRLRIRLAALAFALGFADYSLEVLDDVVKQHRGECSADELRWAKQSRSRLRAAPRAGYWTTIGKRLRHARVLRSVWLQLVSMCAAVANTEAMDRRTRSSVWKD